MKKCPVYRVNNVGVVSYYSVEQPGSVPGWLEYIPKWFQMHEDDFGIIIDVVGITHDVEDGAFTRCLADVTAKMVIPALLVDYDLYKILRPMNHVVTTWLPNKWLEEREVVKFEKRF